jgi:curli biogenesis system outer membrane secretion channel CsgG
LTDLFINKATLIGLLLCFSHLSACKSKVTSSASVDAVQQENEISSEGMSAATIVNYYEKDNDCSFLFILDDNGEMLQAISIPEAFQEENLKVWIDFTYSRRQQGPCPFGVPITLNNLLIRYE